MADLPAQARVVIIGGGVVGCSVAYHLAKLGWTDIVLLERKQLTSGTTWHAAGLIGQLRATQNLTMLAKYSAELYAGLEAETGVATGYRQTGSVGAALSHERLEEFKRGACHAGSYETSLVLAERPELVRDARAALPPRAIDLAAAMRAGVATFVEAGADQAYFGDPAAATVEEGEWSYARLVDMVVTVIREAWP